MSVVSLEHERRRYVEALARVVEALPKAFAQIPEVERVWLFGSYLRGRRDLCTDLDLLVYTPEEFAQVRERGFVKHALAQGRVIYERADSKERLP